MRIVLLAAFAMSVASCGRLHISTTRDPKPNAQVEDLYQRGLAHLDPATPGASLDSASGLLMAYLAYDGYVTRATEAQALLRLTNEARQLARVEAALREAQASTDTTERAPAQGESAAERSAERRAEAALREIARLKDALAKANAELERIRKRLANPKPPGA